MLPAMLIIPLLGAIAIIFAKPTHAKWIATGTSLVTFVISLIAAGTFEHWNDGGYGLEFSMPWLTEFGITMSMGVDSVAMMLILLTTLLVPLCVIGSFTGVTSRLREYYAWMLILQTAMIGVFGARDLIFFYVCFELTLVPMYFLIAAYGSDPTQRGRIATKFFVYTFTGSLLTLAGLIYVAWRYATVNSGWTFEIEALVTFASSEGGLNSTEQALILLAMMLGFGVKVPLFPVHTWLPLAHTEAPTAGSVILAGVLLKLGTYGIYRFVLPMVPDAVTVYAPAIAILAIIGIIYAALICWVQTDVKRLVAYSSVSHLGFCVLGLFALNPLGVQGSVLYMINHGLSTGGLFFLIGMVYERYHTRDMNRIGGLARKMPVWAFFMVFFVLSSVGLPALNGFVSELLCLVGAFTAGVPEAAHQAMAATDPALVSEMLAQATLEASKDAPNLAIIAGHLGDAERVLNVAAGPVLNAQAELAQVPYPGRLGPWYAAVAGLGMILAAMYLLIMVGKVVFGPLKEPEHDDEHHHDHHLPADLSWREIGVLVPLAVLCLYLGLKPVTATDAAAGSVAETIAAYPDQVRDYYTTDAAMTLQDEVNKVLEQYNRAASIAIDDTQREDQTDG